MSKIDLILIKYGEIALKGLNKPAFEQKKSFEALLTTFMEKGGGSIHFNVLSPEVLRKAQVDPEKYQNLQIRLCGWNVRFVNLSKKEQDEFILQSENRV